MDSEESENKNKTLPLIYWNEVEPFKIVFKNDGDKKDRFYYKYRTHENLSNGFRTMHGGSIFTMFNILSKKSILLKTKYNKKNKNIQNDYDISLIEQTTKYLNPVQIESNIIIEITLEKDGKDIIFITGHLYEADNFSEKNENNINISSLKVLCLCNSTYIRRQIKF